MSRFRVIADRGSPPC